jgi:anti-sigma factor RsiW
MHIADNHEALLDYLYEEGDLGERLKIAEHLQECASCSVAVLEFQQVRGMLGSWAPPAAELGFRIVRDPDLSPSANTGEARRGWLWGASIPSPQLRRMSGWAQAAAAILLFAGGMAVSQLHVDYADGSLTVSTQRAQRAQGIRNASITLPSAPVASAPGTITPETLADLERLLSERLARSNAAPVDTAELLQRVRAMIDQSEQRQQRELALRLSQVAREVDTQHQADLLQIQQNVGQTQDLMEYLVRTSGGVK